MRRFVINLDRSPERLARFRELNGRIPGFERFAAIDGRALDQEDLIRRGVLARGHRFGRGTIGSALSHMAIWRLALDTGQPVLIAEDDAVLSLHFDQHLQRFLTSGGEWDLLSCGWNFDMPIAIAFMPGVTSARLQLSQSDLRGNIGHFQHFDYRPRFHRVFDFRGIICYCITPAGARKLIDLCLPLGADRQHFDSSMAEHYKAITAYIMVPPTAVSENDHATSTIKNA